MTAVQTERTIAAEAGGCRFTWCNRFREDVVEFSGEVNHWSTEKLVASAEYWDEEVGVELYGYELRADIHAVRVGLTISDGVCCLSGTTISPAEARELGNVLTGFRAADFPYDHRLLWHSEDLGIYVEFRQPRDRRDGRKGRQTVEVSIREGVNCAADRAQLELGDANKVGRLLLEHADLADKSNAEFGLVERNDRR